MECRERREIMIVIVGGTGSLGSATARRLLKTGSAVRIMTRTLEKAMALRELGAEVVQGDLLDKQSLARACAGAKQVMAAAHSIFGRGRSASKHVDLKGHVDLIDAAAAAGVEHFVYTSAYVFGPAYEAVPFFQFKRQVERYLQSSGMDYTILRPTAFMESHAEMFIGKPILEKGKVTLFGRGENPRNFVAAGDVAQFAVLTLQDHGLKGQTIGIGGPENLTNMAVVRIYEELAGRPVKVSHVPLGALQLMYRILRPLHPGLSQIMRFSICGDTVDSTFDPQPMLARHPVRLTRLEDWAGQRGTPAAVTVAPAVG
jgi:uncharacterized protein YbjT (DUF2867 family)